MITKDIKNCETQFVPADIILLIVQLGTPECIQKQLLVSEDQVLAGYIISQLISMAAILFCYVWICICKTLPDKNVPKRL